MSSDRREPVTVVQNMKYANGAVGTPLDRLMAEEVISDSRQARQLTRRQQMAEAVMTQGTMRIEELTSKFGISLMTAHRDLDDLVTRGLLRKDRGMVSALPTSLNESSDVYRSGQQFSEKKAIAEAAMEFLEPGQAAFFDDSTTVMQMTAHLSEKCPLTVITNSVNLMNEVRGQKDITLLGLGGQYHNWCSAFMGHMTVNEIGRLRADVLFVSSAAIIDNAVFHQSPEMVETKRAMFNSASMRVLLADHSKFERRALHRFASLSEFDVVIVDDATPSEYISRMHAQGINVVIASASQGDGKPPADVIGEKR